MDTGGEDVSSVLSNEVSPEISIIKEEIQPCKEEPQSNGNEGVSEEVRKHVELEISDSKEKMERKPRSPIFRVPEGSLIAEIVCDLESLPKDVQDHFLKIEAQKNYINSEQLELNHPLSNITLPSSNIKNTELSKATLKRKSDSLALISSYQISTDSEEDIDVSGDAFLRPQILSETDSDSESGSDGLPVFNLDSDVASESAGEEESRNHKNKLNKNSSAIKAPGELDIDELPPIKDLQISVKEEECLPFGKVHSIVETLVVIEALPDVPALNLESVLFTKIGQPLGEVFDVFGPVKRPYYTIRFNSRNDIDVKSLSVGTVVYCAPKTKYTQYVFIHQLAKMKGSDASWKGDAEPPPGYEEYSDDEEERRVKREKKQSRTKILVKGMIDVDEPPKKVPSFEERMNRQNTIRNQLFSNRPVAPRRGDWFRNTSHGAGRPLSEEGPSRANNIIRGPHFTAPPLIRPDYSPPISFSLGQKLRSPPPPPPPPPASHFFPLMKNQTSPNFPYSPTPPSPSHVNGNSHPMPFNSIPLPVGFPLFQRFDQSPMINQSTNSQNLLPSNSSSFQGRFGTSSNQGWPPNPSFGSPPPFMTANNCPIGFPQNRPVWPRSLEGQGPPSKTQRFPSATRAPPRFLPPPEIAFMQHSFQPQNRIQFPGHNPPMTHSSGVCPFPTRSPPFGSQSLFSSPQNQAPPQQYVGNNQQQFPSVPNNQQVNNRTCFPHNGRSFPPK